MKRILILASNPKRTSVLDLDLEIRDIQEDWGARGGLQGLQNLQDINLSDLKKIRTKVVYYSEI